jgi:hypothetical protein
VKPSVEERILSLRKGGMGILKIGRAVGVGTSVVQRLLAGWRRPPLTGRFVSFGPDLIPKQIQAQTEQESTRQDEKHRLRNISHVEIPHPSVI